MLAAAEAIPFRLLLFGPSRWGRRPQLVAESAIGIFRHPRPGEVIRSAWPARFVGPLHIAHVRMVDPEGELISSDLEVRGPLPWRLGRGDSLEVHASVRHE